MAADPSSPRIHPILSLGSGGLISLRRILVDIATRPPETASTEEPVTHTRRKANGANKSNSASHPRRPDIVTRARAWLERSEPAISGSGGHDRTFSVVERVVRGFDIKNDQDALEALSDWNHRCKPPWSKKELLHKIQHGRDTGDTPLGELRDAPIKEIPGAASPPPPPPTAPASDGTPPRTPDPRPIIQISTELHHNVDRSVVALKADPHLYQRDGKLTHVTRVTREQSEKSPTVPVDTGTPHHALVEGSPQIMEMGVATLRERLTKFAVYQKWNERSQGYKGSLPTDPIVTATHARGEWPVRTLVGITETPTLRPDGSVVQDAGYDAATGYLYVPSEPFPRVPDKPTQLDAVKALRELVEIFADFPYVKDKEDAHRMVPVAAILTLIARPAIQGATPAFVFDASTRGSGKTLQTDAIAMVVSGRTMPRMNYPAQEEELEKVLASYALRGAQFFSLDNVTRPFGGGALDRVITARDTVDLRVLGRSEVPTLSWRAVVLATGNNMTIYHDTARRILLARLEPDEEQPEKRSNFVHDDLPGWLRKERARLVVCALTVLRAYFVNGCPNQGCDRWGSFEEWSRLVPQAIVWAGGADPMKVRASSDSDVDSELATMSVILKELRKIMGVEPFRAGEVVRTLFQTARRFQPNGQVIADELENLREAIVDICDPRPGKGPDAKTLGKRFARYRGRVIEGLRLTATAGQGGISAWKVVDLNVAHERSST